MINDMEYDEYRLESTFIISCSDEQGRKKRGSCFSVNTEYVVTAWHVVNSMDKYWLYLNSDDAEKNNSIQLELVHSDEALDIAILKAIDYVFDNYIQVSDENCNKGEKVKACGYPIEKGIKHSTLDSEVSESYYDIETEKFSFEIEQRDKVSNYKGMSGTPIIVNKLAVGILLVQQGGTSLYGISFNDVIKKNKLIIKYLHSKKTRHDPHHVLFYRYSNESERFYFVRDEDRIFGKSILLNNIWLSGDSGSGKTALINRNIIFGKMTHCYIDFSAVTVLCKDDVLNEIFYSLCEQFEVDELDKGRNIIKDISRIINEIGSNKLVIVIDELSINSEELLKDISNGLMQLVNYISNSYGQNKIKFSVSTIHPPSSLLFNASKAQEFFHFIDCNSWSDCLEELFDILSVNLCLDIEYAKSFIVEKSKCSPRILKSIFREIILLDDINIDKIKLVTNKVLSEVVSHA
ncbi:serine protease [Vibrio sp. F13]|uniref:serine protease n=1 Tax=Vibrio sp. F13 TaxID=2070777 RepID=UPI0010BD9178|nr:serine protease [Vibrio sp. F13]TKG03332.1 hypothetical protein FCV76_06690 [Vibrio sp. F13]